MSSNISYRSATILSGSFCRKKFLEASIFYYKIFSVLSPVKRQSCRIYILLCIYYHIWSYFPFADEELEKKILSVGWKHNRIFQVWTGKILIVAYQCYFQKIQNALVFEKCGILLLKLVSVSYNNFSWLGRRKRWLEWLLTQTSVFFLGFCQYSTEEQW